METERPSRHIGRKTWYSVAIGLSVVVIVISIGAIIGAWWLQSTLGNTVVRLLAAVEKSAAGGRLLIGRLDQGLEEIQGMTSGISDASEQLSQNVTDKGLVLTLLPEEREDKLVERVTSLAESIQSVVDVARSALEMYRAIDSIPFVSLPKPDEEAVMKLEQTMSGIQSAAQELAQGVKDFRNGVTSAIGRVTEAAERIDTRLGESRQNLMQLDASLAALQQMAADLQSRLPRLFMLAALFSTLFLAYVSYTQVELIRTLLGRWRALNTPTAAEPQMKVFEAETVRPETIEKGEEEASGSEETTD